MVLTGGAAGVGVIPPGVGLDIGLVMSDRTLFDGDNEPAFLTGYGPIPAPLARRLVREAAPKVKSWIRRLYTDPGSGQLIDADSKRRTFSQLPGSFWWPGIRRVVARFVMPRSGMPIMWCPTTTVGRPGR